MYFFFKCALQLINWAFIKFRASVNRTSIIHVGQLYKCQCSDSIVHNHVAIYCDFLLRRRKSYIYIYILIWLLFLKFYRPNWKIGKLYKNCLRNIFCAWCCLNIDLKHSSIGSNFMDFVKEMWTIQSLQRLITSGNSSFCRQLVSQTIKT